jgi:hypothetical protein
MKRWVWCLLGRHDWTFHQHVLHTEDGTHFVIAWEQCEECGKSVLVHILK